MNPVYLDPDLTEDGLRREIYGGRILLFSPTAASQALAAFARDLCLQAFAPRDPRTAHRELPVEEYVRILSVLKPHFIHHPRSKELLRELFTERGFDLDRTYFDVPRLRTAAPGGYLSTGIAYAFHPHRDTWYSAPLCQINWWMPIWPNVPENAMAFHPRYWSEPLRNSSRIYNYRRWNEQSRFAAADQIKTDTRPQPKAEEPVDRNPSLVFVLPPGGMLMFSAGQLHSTVDNVTDVTRFSVDFRTVNLTDVGTGVGAPRNDTSCTGTSLGDFLRARDAERISQRLVDRYDTPEVPVSAVS
jgi:hypothetical protein